MFGIEPSEYLLVAIVALVVIGPKDLPRVMRIVGQWVGRAKGMARHFRAGFDEMVRQSEMEEMEKRWAAENARIMAEHPTAAPPEEADDAHQAMLAASTEAMPVEPAAAHPEASEPEAAEDEAAPQLPLPTPARRAP
ncbi:Sec-independent protein translocase protein TatB [Sphingomonas bacterium]|uniref:Sec-independent protein translocase protein TatB n=1 Tax=Sphingomonas bacterium TaxID=1895847 RepID=UPI0015765CD8|nr:Sec-independent protein translocase protein TatB [Sphingomonas bacterium]